MRAFAFFCLSLVACSGSSSAPSPDAGVTSSDLVGLLRTTPGLDVARHLDGALIARDGAFVRATSTSRWRPLGALEATVSGKANGVTHLGVEDAADVWLEVSDQSLPPVAATVQGSALLFRAVSPDVDLVQVAGQGVVEELRVLRAPRAHETVRWTLRRGPGLARVSVEGDVVHAWDASGRLRFETRPAVAVDAVGASRPVHLHLEGDELVADADLSGAIAPVVFDPTWTAAASMLTARVGFPGLVSGGTVYAVGGSASVPVLSAAERWTESTGWTAMPDLPVGFGYEDGVMGATGPIVFGGASQYASYKWSGSSWTSLSTWVNDRSDSVSFYEPTTDQVFVFGGQVVGTISKSGVRLVGTTWSALPDMATARSRPCGARLGANKFLVVGGMDVSTAEIYDHGTGAWTAAGALSVARDSCATVTLPSGDVVVAGGYDGAGGSSKAVDVYRPSTNTWSTGPSLAFARMRHTGVLLSSGKILFAGGDETSAEVWDRTTGGAFAGALSNRHARVVGLPGDKALAMGGQPGVVGAANKIVELWQQANLGDACTGAGECKSGFCVDGVCCNAACTESCKACNLTATKGTCSAVTGLPVGARSCAPIKLCEAGACKASCGGDSDCVSTHYCSSGTCLPKKTYGGSCDRDAMCGVGTCADGVCCNTACTGQCEYCADPSSLGTCIAVVGSPRTGHPACSGLTDPTCGIHCDGLNRATCTYPGASTPCGSNTCVGGVEKHASNCTGSGTCGDVPGSCGVYTCGATKCNTTCSSTAPCATGYYCSSGTCVPLEGTGKTCTDSSSCGTGLTCVDGVCCTSSACGAGESCALPKTLGRCAKKNGEACSTNASCGSELCVDGVCCDRACTGQCEACDVTGSVGSCTAVSGDPHGARTRCDAGSELCKAMTCDGAKDPSRCVGFKNGTTTTCKPGSCSGTSYTESSSCDGMGTCKAPPSSSCVPYACDDKGCLKSCTTNAQCAEGYSCSANVCVQGAHCSDDQLSSIPKGGGAPVSCGAYRCGTSGECLTECASTTQCATGYACDGKSCVATAAPSTSSDEGGCSTSPGRAGAPGLLLLALLLLRRRR